MEEFLLTICHSAAATPPETLEPPAVLEESIHTPEPLIVREIEAEKQKEPGSADSQPSQIPAGEEEDSGDSSTQQVETS